MTTPCNYHEAQLGEIVRAWTNEKYSTGEAALERQALAAEMSRCGDCPK